MTALTTFLDTYWWLIPLAMMGLCFLAMKKGSICCGLWEGHRSDDSALDILDRRFASGEIGGSEYEEKILTMGLRNRG
jgi:uncharacterized membrane protein